MKSNLLLAMCLFLFLEMKTTQAQKPKVQVEFAVSPNTPFSRKFKKDILSYEKSARDTLIKGLNEFIAFANFQTSPQKLKLKIELKSEMAGEVSQHFFFFTFNPGDGTDIEDYPWVYLEYHELNSMTPKVSEALDNLSYKWFEFLKGNYDIGLTQILFPNLYLPIPGQGHYRGNNKVVLPESRASLKLDAELSTLLVTVAFKDEPKNFIPQGEVRYAGDFKENIPLKLKGCITVSMQGWEPDKVPVGGKVYFREYKRKIYETISH